MGNNVGQCCDSGRRCVAEDSSIKEYEAPAFGGQSDPAFCGMLFYGSEMRRKKKRRRRHRYKNKKHYIKQKTTKPI